MVKVFNDFDLVWVIFGGMDNYLMMIDVIKFGLNGC